MPWHSTQNLSFFIFLSLESGIHSVPNISCYTNLLTSEMEWHFYMHSETHIGHAQTAAEMAVSHVLQC